MTILDFNNARLQFDRDTITADSIRDRLNGSAESFVRWLYSGRALIKGGNARIGDVYGTPGASLSIELAGKDVGMWHDHATNDGGDLISLYRRYMGYTGTGDFVHSLREIASDFLNDPIEVPRPPWAQSPLQKIEEAKARLGTKPRADMLELGAPVATYRYYDMHGNVTASVVRYEPDGTRENKTFRPYCFRTVEGQMRWVAGAPDLRPLYRLPQIAPARSVVLVEGEGCAEALARVGIDSTSAMQGARAPIDSTDWSMLTGKAVTIWPDNDEPGRAYAIAAAARLKQLGCQVRIVPPPAGKPPKWDAADCVREGEDVAAVLSTAVELNAELHRGLVLEVLNMEEVLNMSDPRWLVSGLVIDQALGFIYGPPGSLKSFIALDLALSFATGQPEWWGRAIQRSGAVVYISSEGQADLKFRVKAWEMHRGVDAREAPFYLIRESINFMKGEDITKLLLTLQALVDKKGPICAVFIDTVSRVLPGAEENLQKDMTLFVNACDAIRQRFEAVVIAVHHTNSQGGFRGSTVMPAAGDFMLEVRRESGAMSGSIFVQKIKAGVDGWEQYFKAQKIQINGLVGATSLVVDGVDDRPHEENRSLPSRELCREILAAIDEQWAKGTPWCYAPNTSRWAVKNIVEKFRLKRDVVKDLLAQWNANGLIEEAMRDAKNHVRGYRKLADL